MLQVDYDYYLWTAPGGRGRLQRIRTGTPGSSTSLQDLSYTYDAVGNVVAIEDSKAVSPTVHFGYDQLDRLILVSGAYRDIFSYDAIGNLTGRGAVASYTYDQDKAHAARRVTGRTAVMTQTVTIRARGVAGGGSDPQMALRVNGTDRATWSVISDTTYSEYTIATPLTGRDVFEVRFTNGGEGRELWVDSVTVGPVTPPAPAELSHRVWLPLVLDSPPDMLGQSISADAGALAYGDGPVTVQAEGGAMLYGRGAGDEAFVAPHAGPGRERLAETGALRFALGPNAFAGEYDANGNLSSRVVDGQGQVLTYDAENRLAGITHGDTVVAITYDGDGNRVETVITDTSGVTTTVHISGYYEWSEGAGRKYYYHNGQRVAMRDGSGLYWLLTDHLGSTAVVATSTGAWAGELRYTAWGETRESSGALPTDYRFTGQRWQDRIGLYDYQARWYDPALGRFLQPDTIVSEPGNPQDLNRYSYASNNPLRCSDPTGHWVETVWDVANVAWDICEVKRDPSFWNIAALVIDVGAVIIPAVPAGAGLIARGGKAAKVATEVATHADELLDAARAVGRVDDAVDIARSVDRAQELGKWVPEVSSMSRRAAKYHEFVTGVQGEVFELGGVRFDGFRNGTLIEAKGYLQQFVDPVTGSFRRWFSGKGELIDQARRQLVAAQGAPLQWHFSEASVLEAVRRAFAEAGISGIELLYAPLRQ